MKNFKQTNIFILLLITGCASFGNDVADRSNIEICPDERPDMCTMIYNPVCATLQNKVKKTYSSDCSACADKKVIGFKIGQCE